MALTNSPELNGVIDFKGSEVPTSQQILIAFKLIPQNNGSHTGIIYSDSKTAFNLLHLAGHNDLENRPNVRSYLGVLLDIDEQRARSVAAFCRSIWKMNGKNIPYGIFFDKSQTFQTNGKFLKGRGGKGYTCATFVLAILQSIGFDLLELDTWLPRDDDTEWQEIIIADLKARGASDEHINGVVSDIGCLRYRPAEVAGAGLENYYPVNFTDAQIKAQDLKMIASSKST